MFHLNLRHIYKNNKAFKFLFVFLPLIKNF